MPGQVVCGACRIEAVQAGPVSLRHGIRQGLAPQSGLSFRFGTRPCCCKRIAI